MEENNRKGPGVFYAVVGVATLVVAIIGATFAYFSASVTPDNGSSDITGQTQDVSGASLSLNVERLAFTGIPASDLAKYDTLVPAWFGAANATPAALGVNQVKTMISSKCDKLGYRGCHVYKITASADRNIAYANLWLTLNVDNNANDENTVEKSQWGYVVFTSSTGTGTAVGTGTQTAIADGTNSAISLLQGNGAPAAIGDGVTKMDIHHNNPLSEYDSADATKSLNQVVYYLLVYVNDTNTDQNSPELGDPAAANTHYVLANYTGSVELEAMGGKIRAAFGDEDNIVPPTAG